MPISHPKCRCLLKYACCPSSCPKVMPNCAKGTSSLLINSIVISVQMVITNKISDSVTWNANLNQYICCYISTSNGGCRRKEKSRKHWSLFSFHHAFVLSYCILFLFVRSNQKQLNVLIALKIKQKKN